MKLWLVTRKDRCDYDEYNALVWRQTTAAETMNDVLTKQRYQGFTKDNINVVELTAEGEPGEVLGDFKAG